MDRFLRLRNRIRLIREISISNKELNNKVEVVKSKDKIRIVFYVLNLGMWKSDRLFRLLLDDEHFLPVIVSYLYEKDPLQYNIDRSNEMRHYFETKGFPFMEGFDFQKGKMIDVDTFSPDIVFYPQPYLNDIDFFPQKALLAYIPYSFMMSDLPELHNFLFQNICWRMFYPTDFHKSLEAKYSYNKGCNVVVTGHSLEDSFTEDRDFDDSMWKQKNRAIKRIIWAPHHSIFANDPLDIATFLDIADDMLELARRLEGYAQFVFKPHPRLEPKLHLAKQWGKERTDTYFNEWRNRSNTSVVDGSYVDLFATSDALIHDCGTFSAEYLYVNKPVMFLSNKNHIDRFNDFANECYRVHYHGTTISEIYNFIKMVIDGHDYMRDERTSFIMSTLYNHPGNSVAENIFNEICGGLNIHQRC